MNDIKIKHPTHIGASLDKDGQSHNRSLYLELNDKGNWVEFCKSPGEWDVETCESVLDYSSWDYRLVDIREVTQEDLVRYWTDNQREATRNKRHSEGDVKMAELELARRQESLKLCGEWIVWATAHLKDVQDG